MADATKQRTEKYGAEITASNDDFRANYFFQILSDKYPLIDWRDVAEKMAGDADWLSNADANHTFENCLDFENSDKKFLSSYFDWADGPH